MLMSYHRLEEGETMYMYLVVTKHVVSAVLIRVKCVKLTTFFYFAMTSVSAITRVKINFGFFFLVNVKWQKNAKKAEIDMRNSTNIEILEIYLLFYLYMIEIEILVIYNIEKWQHNCASTISKLQRINVVLPNATICKAHKLFISTYF